MNQDSADRVYVRFDAFGLLSVQVDLWRNEGDSFGQEALNKLTEKSKDFIIEPQQGYPSQFIAEKMLEYFKGEIVKVEESSKKEEVIY